jgi:hypothetical protein
MVILRCYDFAKVRLGFEAATATKEQSAVGSAIDYLNTWGLSEALGLFWGKETRNVGIPVFKCLPEFKRWGDSLLQMCGRIRLVEHLLELARVGLLEIQTLSENHFHMSSAADVIGVEAIEREDLDCLSELYGKRAAVFSAHLDVAKSNAIKRIMQRLVRPSHGFCIQYEADPEVDEYYLAVASSFIPTRLGWDAFPLTATFGDIEFETYLAAVTMIASFALKHIDFSALLCAADNRMDIFDVVTIPNTRQRTVEHIAEGTGCSWQEAEKIYLSLSVDADDAAAHFRIPAGAPSLHYEVGRGHTVRLMDGCLNNPFYFMLRKLKRLYPADWDQWVNHREDLFRNDLIDLFSRFDGLVFLSSAVNIDSAFGGTDIDALAFDPAARKVGLFQLKWQEPFGSSVRERESRKANFLKANEWVQKVLSWISEKKLPRALRSLGLPDSLVNNIQGILVFVLGRNASHFSGFGQMDCRAAWGSWAHLSRLVESLGDADPLQASHDRLKLDSPARRVRLPEVTKRVEVAGLTITIDLARSGTASV